MISIPAGFRHLSRAATGALLALCALSAHADFQSSISVHLIAPGGVVGDSTPINLQQVVAPANFSSGITVGDGSPIGAWLLSGEKISFSGNSIRVTAYAGADTPGGTTTGYLGLFPDKARYVFDGLSIAGKTIVGVTATAFDGFNSSGVSGLAPSVPVASLVNLIDADSVSLNLSDILFADRGANVGSSEDHADFLINLITSDITTEPANDVPEPGGLALMALAAAAAGIARRRT